MTFEEWWMRLKPAEVDELKEIFKECWELSADTEREACAKVCEAQALEPECPERAEYCADAIRLRSNDGG